MLTAYYYVLGNRARPRKFDIRGETSACAQDGPPNVPKTDRCPSYAQLICPMLKHRIILVPTRYRLLLLHVQYTVVFMNENLELKITLRVKLNPYATGAACFSQFSKLAQ